MGWDGMGWDGTENMFHEQACLFHIVLNVKEDVPPKLLIRVVIDRYFFGNQTLSCLKDDQFSIMGMLLRSGGKNCLVTTT